jgi:hypothetical protein
VCHYGLSRKLRSLVAVPHCLLKSTFVVYIVRFVCYWHQSAVWYVRDSTGPRTVNSLHRAYQTARTQRTLPNSSNGVCLKQALQGHYSRGDVIMFHTGDNMTWYALWTLLLLLLRLFDVLKHLNFKSFLCLSRPGILHAPAKFSLPYEATETPTTTALSSYLPVCYNNPRMEPIGLQRPIQGRYFIHTAVTPCRSVTTFGSTVTLRTHWDSSRQWIPRLSDIPLISDSSTSECKIVFQVSGSFTPILDMNLLLAPESISLLYFGPDSSPVKISSVTDPATSHISYQSWTRITTEMLQRIIKTHHKVYKNARKVKLTDFKQSPHASRAITQRQQPRRSATLGHVGKW